MSSGRPGSSRRRAGLVVATAVLVAAAVALVLTGAGDDGDDHSRHAAAPFGMAHVHGLGIDPQDGQLLAGTHYGTFRIAEDGTAEQVGPTQDYMGFTVVGPRHYLASGHPGADQDAPPNLGLIESTDAGKTWESVSLRGEADFHALEARHGRVYGHSGGRLMVSQDKQAWDERATIPLADLAVSPEDPETLLATTQQGLAISTDGGRTFELVPGAPTVVLVAWTDAGTVIGVGPDGAVHRGESGGASWQEAGSTGGRPAALTATDQAVYVATADGRILESTDGGRSFEVRYRES